MDLSPVPRLLFEGWSHEDFRSVWDSEDEIEELSKTMVQVAKVRPGAPHGWHGLPGRGPSPAVQCWLQEPGCGEAHRSPGLCAAGSVETPVLLPSERGSVSACHHRTWFTGAPHCPGPFRASILTASWWRSGASCPARSICE